MKYGIEAEDSVEDKQVKIDLETGLNCIYGVKSNQCYGVYETKEMAESRLEYLSREKLPKMLNEAEKLRKELYNELITINNLVDIIEWNKGDLAKYKKELTKCEEELEKKNCENEFLRTQITEYELENDKLYSEQGKVYRILTNESWKKSKRIRKVLDGYKYD